MVSRRQFTNSGTPGRRTLPFSKLPPQPLCRAPLHGSGDGPVNLGFGGADAVFAAGDAVRGASLVVWAVREGQDAAAEIHGWLSARQQVAA